MIEYPFLTIKSYLFTIIYELFMYASIYGISVSIKFIIPFYVYDSAQV